MFYFLLSFQAALAAEKEVQPVGEDYVEEERNASGKLIQYNCKLCDCKFSDPNAKNIHIKGRKHRLQYKVLLLHADSEAETLFFSLKGGGIRTATRIFDVAFFLSETAWLGKQAS